MTELVKSSPSKFPDNNPIKNTRDQIRHKYFTILNELDSSQRFKELEEIQGGDFNWNYCYQGTE